MELRKLLINDDFLTAKVWFVRCTDFIENCKVGAFRYEGELEENMPITVAYSYLRMTVFVNECLIKMKSD